jgi:hypothetical protein
LAIRGKNDNSIFPTYLQEHSIAYVRRRRSENSERKKKTQRDLPLTARCMEYKYFFRVGIQEAYLRIAGDRGDSALSCLAHVYRHVMKL